MEIFNPTFERFEIQYDSRVYDFKPKQFLTIPEWPRELGQEILTKGARYGIFEVKPGIEKGSPEFKSEERKALKAYLEGRLATRIANYNSYKDAMDKAGKTVDEDYNYLKAKRWKSEISKAISYEEELMGEESFLPKREKVSQSKAV